MINLSESEQLVFATDEANSGELVYSKMISVRKTLARQGFQLEKLSHDKHWLVRAEVARKGFKLERFLNDDSWNVRLEVARHGFRLEQFVNDREWIVRAAVAAKGEFLETLIEDEFDDVRLEVAKQGFGLDVLINDESTKVSNLALQKMATESFVIEKNIGTYAGSLCLYVYLDKYLIISGCYETNSVDEWIHLYETIFGEEKANFYGSKIKAILNSLQCPSVKQ